MGRASGICLILLCKRSMIKHFLRLVAAEFIGGGGMFQLNLLQSAVLCVRQLLIATSPLLEKLSKHTSTQLNYYYHYLLFD